MNRLKNYMIVVLSVFISIFLTTSYAPAGFSLSVTPYEGGYDLRFGKVSPAEPRVNKEVVVRVTSDIGKQYRLIQQLLEPLASAQGASLPQNNLFVYGIRGTNKYGTLAVEQEIPVFPGRTIIYTSNSNGLSDSFTLVYAIKGPLNVPSGSYRGRIAYILEPIDSTQEQVTVILNVYAEIEAEAGIEIGTATGSKRISLSSKRAGADSAEVQFEIKAGLGRPFRILQQLLQPLRSPEGRELPQEAINFAVSGAKAGSGPAQFIPLSPRTDEVYRSGLRGEADSFLVTYALGDLSRAGADRYSANIRYLLEEAVPAQTKIIDTFDLDVEIERIFDLLVETESGSSVIEFRGLKPQQPAKTYEVLIEINTNIGRQYQVTQNMLSKLVSREGYALPFKYFTLRTESLDTKGVLKFPQSTEARQGDMVLFVSDMQGSPDKFRIVYELEPSLEIPAGDYSALVVYSLSEI